MGSSGCYHGMDHRGLKWVSSMGDNDYFRQSLAEYRENTGDSRDFAELPSEMQGLIIHRAQQLQQRTEQEKRG